MIALRAGSFDNSVPFTLTSSNLFSMNPFKPKPEGKLIVVVVLLACFMTANCLPISAGYCMANELLACLHANTLIDSSVVN